jgi:hypothetical protein
VDVINSGVLLARCPFRAIAHQKFASFSTFSHAKTPKEISYKLVG